MKNLFRTGCVALLCLLCLNIAVAQTTKADKKAAQVIETNRIINSKHYIFKANYVLPLSGGGKYLNADYDVTLTKDKISIYLPYFGRAYSAPMDATDGGIKLNTSNFDYKADLNKKGMWEITIKPNDKNLSGSKDVQTMRLTVGADLSASLRVTCFNRDAIGFNGNVGEVKKEKEVK